MRPPRRSCSASPRRSIAISATEFGDAAGIPGELFEIPGLVYSAEQMAVAGVTAMEKGRRVVVPGPTNVVGAVGGRMLPRRLVLELVDRFYPVGK